MVLISQMNNDRLAGCLEGLGRIYTVRFASKSFTFDNLFLISAVISFCLHIVVVACTPIILLSDSGSFISGAARICEGYPLTDSICQTRVPGFSIFLAGLAVVFGPSGDLPYQIISHLMGFIELIVVYAIARMLTENIFFSGLVSLACSFCILKITYCNVVLSETLFSLLVSIGICLSIHCLKRQNPFTWAVGCFFFMSAALTRPQGMFFLVIHACLILAYPAAILLSEKLNLKVRRIPIKLLITCSAAGFMTAFLPVFAWSCTRYDKYGHFGLTTYSGICLYDGVINYGELIDEDSPSIRECKKIFEWYKMERSKIGLAYDEKVTFTYHWPMAAALTNYYQPKNGSMSKASEIMERAVRDGIRKYPAGFLKLWFSRIITVMGTSDASIYYTNCLAENPERNPLVIVRDPRRNYARWLSSNDNYGKIFTLRIGRENILNHAYTVLLVQSYSFLHGKGVFAIFLPFIFAGFLLCFFFREKSLFALYSIYIIPGFALPFIATTAQFRHRCAMEFHLVMFGMAAICLITRFILSKYATLTKGTDDKTAI